ncbi:MAG TPA: bifunctional glutamate N-acetyltransferase/amino-acid acetyltransferase ArgJ [Candidatus Fimenecus excrementavium]|nr:bifunctional glutamate N-acetyltransferase/amino-acid acetyltransferase ArgJ [Candidatus Fimenecus excrementavium]
MHIEILKEGGVTAPKGFRANGIHCGIRKNKDKKDLMLIVSDVLCDAAAVYTQNLVCGAPVTVTRENLKNGKARAVICNSGIANTCNADGVEKAEAMCALTEQYTGIPANDVVVASTGVIGQPIDLEPIQSGMQTLVDGLNENGSSAAAQAIMTTDTVKKEIAVSVELSGGKTCTLGAIAKGSGMIHPNMATMLSFITTDANISAEMLQKALRWCVTRSYNMLSVDGDTSTNDTVAILANGLCGNTRMETENEDYAVFCRALFKICNHIVRMLAKDGEGATKLVVCEVVGAADEETARICAKSVIRSPLVKTAMFGSDANWGRVLCALGYAGAAIDVSKIDVSFRSRKGTVPVCKNGAGIEFSEEKAKEVLLEDEIEILVDLNSGDAEATAYGCDLTYDYVKINGDYRT